MSTQENFTISLIFKTCLVQCLYESFEEEAVFFFQFATSITSNDIDEIQKFLDAIVDDWYSFTRVGCWDSNFNISWCVGTHVILYNDNFYDNDSLLFAVVRV